MCLLVKVDTRFVTLTSVTVLDKRCADHKDTHTSKGKNQLISYVNYHFTKLIIRFAIIV